MSTSIEKMFASPDDEVRREAVMMLSSETVPMAVSMLIEALRDSSWRVRKTAVNVLVESFSPDAYMDPLVKLLYDGDNAGARNSAIEVFVRMGARSCAKLEQAYVTDDADVRKFVIDIAGEIAHRNMIPLLVRALVDEDDNVKAAAVEHLGDAKEKGVVDALIDMLKDGQLWTSYPAIEALGRIGDPLSLPVLIKSLDNSLLREPALRSLGGFEGAVVIADIVPYLFDKSKSVRQEALTAIEGFYQHGMSEQDIVAEIIKIYSIKDASDRLYELSASTKGRPRVSCLILLALLKDNRAIKPLLEASVESENTALIIRTLVYLCPVWPDMFLSCLSSYTNDDIIVRILASVIADASMPEFFATLGALVAHEDGHVRAVAVRGFGNIGDPAAVDILIEALNDEYRDVRESAMQSLIKLREYISADMLEELAKDKNPEIRKLAVPLLSVLEEDGSDCLKGILLDDPSHMVRKVSVQYLSQRLSPSCQSYLIGSVDDEHPDVRSTAAIAIGKTRNERFLAPLATLLSDDEPIVRVSACKAMGIMGFDNVIDYLRPMLEDDNGFVVATALEAAAKIKTIEAKDMIASMLTSSDREILCTAIRSLAEFDDIKKLILPYLDSDDWAVRYEVAKALISMMHSPEVQELVQRAYEVDSDTAVRDALKDLLDV